MTDAIDARLVGQTRQLNVAAVAGPTFHAPAFDAGAVDDVADLRAEMTVTLFATVKTVFA